MLNGFANLLHVFVISLFQYFSVRALWCSRVFSGAPLAHDNGRRLTFNRFFILGKLEIFSLKLRLRLPFAYLLWLIAFICNLLCKFTQVEYGLLTHYIWTYHTQLAGSKADHIVHCEDGEMFDERVKFDGDRCRWHRRWYHKSDFPGAAGEVGDDGGVVLWGSG